MNSFSSPQRIVVGIDGSKGAVHAAEWAAQLAGSLSLNLHLLNALNLGGTSSLLSRMPFEEYRQHRTKQAEELLDEVRAGLLNRFPNLWISTEVSTQEPTEALHDAGAQAAFTVVGTRGHGGFPGLRLGSVGLRLAAHGRGPVILVPEEGEPVAEPVKQRNEVAVGVAVREPSLVIDFAFDLAEKLSADLRGVHAWEPIPPYNGYYYIEPVVQVAAAEELLDAALEPGRQAHEKIRTTADTVSGNAAKALIEAGHGARVLVLGAHRHRTALSIGVGSVLHAVLTHAPCPVAVVPLAWLGA